MLHLPALDQIEIVIFMRRGSDNLYILAPEIKYTHELSDHPMLGWIMNYNHTKIDLASHCLANEENWFLVCSADCYDPPCYVVSVRDESDVQQEFITNTKICVIEKEDLPDYIDDTLKDEWIKHNSVEEFDEEFTQNPWDFLSEDITINDNGEPCDTSSITWEEVFPVLVIRKATSVK